VVALRGEHKVGPVQLVGKLAEENLTLPASTIYRILVRHGASRLRDLDVIGEDLREAVIRYEWDRPGDLVHVDVKKIGRIPDGGGWRVHGRGSAQHRASGRAKSAGAEPATSTALRGRRPLPAGLHRRNCSMRRARPRPGLAASGEVLPPPRLTADTRNCP